MISTMQFGVLVTSATIVPGTQVVSVAVVPQGTLPGSSDWNIATWVGSYTTNLDPSSGKITGYSQQVTSPLFGPTGGVINPAAGKYRPWLKVAVGSQTIIFQATGSWDLV